MTVERFEEILSLPESKFIDYKKEQYKIVNDHNNAKTAEFVKDIVSFSNTIRDESCYIILGVKVLDGTKIFEGLNEHIDDAIFQQKIKDKVFPIPSFKYQTINYKGRIYGIIEIPVEKYVKPITPIIKMKGLEPGKIYFRRGTSNSEANHFEAIEISKWMDYLPDDSFNDFVLDLIQRLSTNDTNLSSCVSHILKFAIKFNIANLKEFCLNEIGGYNVRLDTDYSQILLSYRIEKVICSQGQLQMPKYSDWSYRTMMAEIKKLEGIQEVKFFFHYPITRLEEHIIELSSSKNNILIISQNIENIRTEFYFSLDNVKSIYSNIRNKLLNEMINIQNKSV